MKCICLTFWLLGLAWPIARAADKILFIRGGVGTVGFFEGGSDEQGASIDNFLTSGGNHGWGELAAALRAEGFEPTEVTEDPVVSLVPTPVQVDTMDLSRYAVIVFGSNNAEYTTAQVDALVAYVSAGGAALFVSDANFGQNWGDAPSSDQHFLDRFGLTMNQDRGTYTIDRAEEFVVPAHPIFNGVNTFDGEGVSPITVSATVAGVTTTVLAGVPSGQTVRRNTGAAQGPLSQSTANDGTLVITTLGSGRIAGHFDRNTFFNENGAGTNLNRFENEEYARNLFNWLAGKPAFDPATQNYAPRLHFPTPIDGTEIAENTPFTFTVVAKDPDGTVAQVQLLVNGSPVSTDTTSPYNLTLPGLSPDIHTPIVRMTDNEGAQTDLPFQITVLDLDDVPVPIDRTGWTLTANRSTAELANAIDGNASTRWPTRQFQQPGQWFRIDFGQVTDFESIVLETLANPNDYPRGYILRGSMDGVTFTTLLSGAGDNATTRIDLPARVAYRHIEIEQTGSSPNRWWSIHEINVLAKAGPPSIATWLDPFFTGTPDALDIDGDGDGFTTLEEFAANTDPTRADARPHLIALPGSSGGAPHIDFQFRRWTGSNGLTYRVRGSTGLTNWTAPTITITEQPNPTPNGDGTETPTVRVTFPPGSAQGFVRLEIEAAP